MKGISQDVTPENDEQWNGQKVLKDNLQQYKMVEALKKFF